MVIYGGKKEFVGATILSALAALKTGTGSVKIVSNKDTIQTYTIKFPSVLKAEINNINELKKFLKQEKITSMLIGPGAGLKKPQPNHVESNMAILLLLLILLKFLLIPYQKITIRFCFHK